MSCWRRLLRVPWTARRSNQSILKEISPGISLEGMMLKWNSSTLATSCEELTHWKRLWYWEGLGAGGEGDDREWNGWMESLTRWTWVWVNSRSWWWTGRPGVLRFIGLQRVGDNWATDLNCTEHITFLENTSIFPLCLSIICVYVNIYVCINYVCIYHLYGCSVVSNSLWPHGPQPAWLLCLWDFPGRDTGGDCQFLLLGIFPTQGLNLGLLLTQQQRSYTTTRLFKYSSLETKNVPSK